MQLILSDKEVYCSAAAVNRRIITVLAAKQEREREIISNRRGFLTAAAAASSAFLCLFTSSSSSTLGKNDCEREFQAAVRRFPVSSTNYKPFSRSRPSAAALFRGCCKFVQHLRSLIELASFLRARGYSFGE